MDKDLLNNIIQNLIKYGVEKIILFGSFAYGKPHKDSDLDLMIVTIDEYIPKNYEEKSELTFKVSKSIRDYRLLYPIDLIVHTKKMHERFIESDSSFSREILNKGKVLYERNSLRVA